MNKRKLLCIIKVFLLINTIVWAKSDIIAGNKGISEEVYQISEKILLETDREIYMAGERINIACFTFEPLLQKSLELSKIVYIEFFTSRNLVIKQIKVEMEQGHGGGFIEIPKRLLSGKYYLRAYTNNMKNYGYKGFSYSSVTVLNPFFEVDQKNETGRFTSIIQKCTLYPEGGHIVSGHLNTVTCEFTNNSGNPVPCMARVLDKTDNVITTFTSNEYGLGSFCFVPESDNSYRVEATSGTAIITQNIEISNKAVTLSKIIQDRSKIVFKLLRSGVIEYPLYFVLVYANSSIPVAELSQNDSIISLSVDELPKGIIQLQLRNDSNEIVSIRNVFIPSRLNECIELSTNRTNYKSREKVELSIKHNLENEMNELLSISVFLIDRNNQQKYIESDKQEYLQSALYPVLGGTNYPASEVLKDSIFLEQILLLHTSDESFSKNNPSLDSYEKEYFPEIEYDLIFGVIKDEFGKPDSFSTVIQTWIDTISTMQTTRTNQDGLFLFKMDRIGESELVVTTSEHTTGKISLQKEYYPEFFSLTGEKILVDSSLKLVLNQQVLNLQINDSYFEKGKNNNVNQTIPFYISPDKIFFISDYIALPNLKEFLYEIVPGILPTTSKGKTLIRIASLKTEDSFGNEPLYLVDGVPVFDADLVANIKCADLVSVGIVYEKYFYQNETFDGIIDIHTLKGNASVLELPESVYSVHFIGIQKPGNEGIYSLPDTNSRQPFFKTQLYWNPSVKMDENGEAMINFYTPDNVGDYLIRCSSISPDGSVKYYYTAFTVNGS